MTTTSQIAAIVRSLYPTGPALRRAILRLRPYNCPLDVLLSLLPDSGSVFDIGCGCGLLLGLAVRSGKSIRGVGVDTSKGAIQMAKDMGVEIEFRCVRSIADWPAEHFDAISMIDVMHHIAPAQQGEAFAAAAARVKPGGILIYKDMVRRPFWRAWANRLHDLLFARQWIHYYPIEWIDAAARSFGLTRLRAERIDRLWYGHELRAFRRATIPSVS